MSDLEKINDLILSLKACAVSDIPKYFSQTSSLFRFLPKADKDEVTDEFYKWTEKYIEHVPVKYCYAEFLVALNYFMSDQFEQSLQIITKARIDFKEQNDSEGIGLCSMLTGAIYRTFGNFDLALKTLWEGYGLLIQTGNYPIFIAACANSIANINLEMHNYDEALSNFNIAYNESLKANDFYFNIYALHGLAKVNMQEQKYEEAKGFLQKALQLAEQNNSQMQIANSTTELADFYFNTDNLSESEQLNKTAFSIREQHKFTVASVTNCIHLGEIYIKQSKWQDAQQMLEKGLELAKQTRVKPKMFRVHYLLSEMFQHKNELEKSLYHFKLYHQLREQVEEEDNARKLTDAKLIFEAEQTKKENQIIKKQKEEIQNKNIELQKTIDELTLTKVSRKAKALTLVVAIALFVIQDFMLGFVLQHLPGNNYFLSLIVKMVIIFSLSPINQGIEKYLLKKVIREKKQMHSQE